MTGLAPKVYSICSTRGVLQIVALKLPLPVYPGSCTGAGSCSSAPLLYKSHDRRGRYSYQVTTTKSCSVCALAECITRAACLQPQYNLYTRSFTHFKAGSSHRHINMPVYLFKRKKKKTSPRNSAPHVPRQCLVLQLKRPTAELLSITSDKSWSVSQ